MEKIISSLDAAGYLYLNPRKLQTNSVVNPRNTLIDKSVRAFGFLPNIGELKPGDLLLFCSLKEKYLSKLIQSTQQSGHALIDSCWSHAAVYTGDEFTVCDSRIEKNIFNSGVKVRNIFPYIGNHLIRVRRPNLERDDQWRMVVNAMADIGARYSFLSAFKIFLQGLKAKENTSSSRICSQLYAEAYLKTTAVMIANYRQRNAITPASLSSSLKLTDVPVTWSRIDSSQAAG